MGNQWIGLDDHWFQWNYLMGSGVIDFNGIIQRKTLTFPLIFTLNCQFTWNQWKINGLVWMTIDFNGIIQWKTLIFPLILGINGISMEIQWIGLDDHWFQWNYSMENIDIPLILGDQWNINGNSMENQGNPIEFNGPGSLVTLL